MSMVRANEQSAISIGSSQSAASPLAALPLRLANRHGLIAGATGTGKTITLQRMAECFAAQGVPVFVADIKGDLSGLAAAGTATPRVTERLAQVGEEPAFSATPVIFWDLLGEQGHPLRTTVSEIGPVLLARLLELNEVQAGVLNIVFRVADEQGLHLVDLKDLRAVLSYVAENARQFTVKYGAVATSSVGAIQRGLLSLESQGGDYFLGEPALELGDLLGIDDQGRGYVSVLAADKLMARPRLYATFLLWLMAELFEQLPEVGDLEKPRLVFFFDEAHLLFDDASPALVDEIERVVRLIRSKGVGIYFVTQNPLDLPETVLGQLGNRVQHALRAFTPRDQRAVRTAAETFRPNPRLDTAAVITELGVGEALISLLDGKGVPSPVERCLVHPPMSRIGPLTPAERGTILAASPVAGRYDTAVDRDSAYEQLARGAGAPAAPAGRAPAGQAPAGQAPDPWGRSRRTGAPPSAPPQHPPQEESGGSIWGDILGGLAGGRSGPVGRQANRQSIGEALAKSVVRTIGSEVSRQIARGVLGAILKRR